ncbi:MAG: hypothetical protein A2725_01320 [Candidatus Magasanikbacteria bacterium RIFCSPHIGHO2_01_FULL_33_34]|uniref:Uncharacterized protein n=1 Tax=Candidatus Magasanikbacteria bacterium RIFCSPHIGHO2_01_FULL_33_34 TaxID=1798671 RepID=A0A1F6LJ63_9BACT|nr:MAG: hypothetical protein A2725_01320 [Candidatus Magasanikbacteria bacterium RIFCSPHIGHO2_01_FULL_33_34]OGH65459.1 MAG: hypothetical protein A3B83_01075 [Candidatus Magasanikbacteria bacterium RIFCSPHIGHO2_02_FULL_33_17]OGH76169.1 MAG: hypothetical protein A3A89_01895 [Candidatus Magasanikbacteria bacterium RIFCSPLOWO2_01_FULL_33_34]OGH81017.1 MAG: hypothetical protein A3F93_04530 [Candidatus Magasanikbacteria bacterium RIFCSPLOWO2_12_FULL_34_7]
MSPAKKTKPLTKDEIFKQQEIADIYKRIYKELELLEIEGKELKNKVREIVDKVKTKNILEDIINKHQ